MAGGHEDDAQLAGGYTMRSLRGEDVHEAGQVYFDAFSADSVATGIPANFNLASPDAGRAVIASFMSGPSLYYHLGAFDGAGKLLGAAFVHVGSDCDAHGVGPVYVSPEASNRGIGKALMRGIVEHAQKINLPSVRLNTSGSNRKSFCLYASLGFRPVECTTSFYGRIEPDAGIQAAVSVGISTDGISTRKMEEGDVKACGEMYSKGMGYERENDIREMLTTRPEGCWVATTYDNAVVGYTTGLFMLGHAMATSEAAWVAAISRAIQEKDGVVGCVTIPGVYYPRLINWALAAKLQLARHNWYMVIGDYQKPKDGFFWSPSVQH
ncbi:hypothetical protein M758_1G282700 [Ceratodon purpureus]|nr:hypothetical protein M758_1G282700 [Ceratodon purpureus]